jgi:hypothetical protein
LIKKIQQKKKKKKEKESKETANQMDRKFLSTFNSRFPEGGKK